MAVSVELGIVTFRFCLDVSFVGTIYIISYLLNLINCSYRCKGYDLIYWYKGSDHDHFSAISIYVWQQD